MDISEEFGSNEGINLVKKIQACFFPRLIKRFIWVFGYHRG